MEQMIKDLFVRGCLREEPCDVPLKFVSLLHTGISPGGYRFDYREIFDTTGTSGLSGATSGQGGTEYATRLVCISQNHSFRPLNVTENMLRHVVIEHSISQKFLETVSCFNQKLLNIEESLCSPLQTIDSSDQFEYMYTLQYPEKTNRTVGEPWSVRKTALYHQIRLSDQRSTFLIISPYPDTKGERVLIEFVKDLAGSDDRNSRVFEANSILFDNYFDSWRQYMAHYEAELQQLTLRLLDVGLRDSEGVSAVDITDLKFVESRLLPVEPSLDAFQRLLGGLDKILQGRRQSQAGALSSCANRWPEYYSNYCNKVAAYKDNVRVLERKCTNASQLLDGIFNFHNQTIAHRQSSAVLYLTTSTVDDSATVRVITAITLVFLSFTATAAVLAMPVFYLDDSKALSVSRSVWIYVAIALPLTTVTFLYWRWMLHRSRTRRETKLSTHLGSLV